VRPTPFSSIPPHLYCTRYNKLCGQLRQYAHRLSLLPAADPYRARAEGALLAKLYDAGVLNAQAKLSDVERKLAVAAFCRRRLAVVACAARMAETVSAVRAPACAPNGQTLRFCTGGQVY
jgi:ribosomal protein S4